MSQRPELRERIRRAADAIERDDPPIERIAARGRRRRNRNIAAGIVATVVVAAGVAVPLMSLSTLGSGRPDRRPGDQMPAEPQDLRTTGVGYGVDVTAPSNWSLLVWGESGRYFPEGIPRSQPLFQLTNVDPGLFLADEPAAAWWCPVGGRLPADGAMLLVRVTATSGPDPQLPSWPATLNVGRNECGDGLTASWRSGDAAFEAFAAFGEDVSEADRSEIEKSFAAMRFDDEPRWFALTGSGEPDQAGPMQVLDGGFLRTRPWLLVVFPDNAEAAPWFCSGSIYPEGLPPGSEEPFGQPVKATCGPEGSTPEEQPTTSIVGSSCAMLGPNRFETTLEGFANPNVTSVVIAMDDGDRWETQPVPAPPGFEADGALLWVAPALTGTEGIVTTFDEGGRQIGETTPVKECFGLPDR